MDIHNHTWVSKCHFKCVIGLCCGCWTECTPSLRGVRGAAIVCFQRRGQAFLCRAFPVIGHFALPPPSFLEQGKSDRRGSSSLVWEMEEPRIFFERQGRRHRKGCSSHGCVKGSARFPASFCVKCRAKKPISPFNVCRCHHLVAPRDRRSCLSWAPAVSETPHDPCR